MLPFVASGSISCHEHETELAFLPIKAKKAIGYFPTHLTFLTQLIERQ